MNTKVLVLNQDYQAITVCSVQRAFILVLLQKAEMISRQEELKLRSIQGEFDYPSIIRLSRYVNIPFRKVTLTRQNIFKRDGYQCMYCGGRENLTLDHVVPKSKGGRDTWKNLVSACQKCNSLKGNRTPSQAEMPLIQDPYRPTHIMYLRDFSGKIHDTWKPYLYMN